MVGVAPTVRLVTRQFIRLLDLLIFLHSYMSAIGLAPYPGLRSQTPLRGVPLTISGTTDKLYQNGRTRTCTLSTDNKGALAARVYHFRHTLKIWSFYKGTP